jgi:exodeoxyribonuclease III
MRIITLNANGLRAAHAKGFTPWMRRQKPDIVCLQEIKAQEADLPHELLAPRGLHAFFHPAEKRGCSGMAIYAKREPENVVIGLGIRDIDAQARKYAFMERFMPRLQEMRACAREFVICGDWNIAHKEIDVKNWKTNQKTTGFLPRERDWLTEVLERHGFVDVFRRLDPNPDRFTWWVQWANARSRNIGWRIDYQIATPGIAQLARATSIYTGEIFSDHAPLTVDYEYRL